MTHNLVSSALLWTAACLALAAPAAAQSAPSAGTGQCDMALNGSKLAIPTYPAPTQKRLDENIAIARSALAIAPDREDHYIWLGRHPFNYPQLVVGVIPLVAWPLLARNPT